MADGHDRPPGPHEPRGTVPASSPPDVELRRIPGVLRHLQRLSGTLPSAGDGSPMSYVSIYSRRPGQQHGENIHEMAPPLDLFFAQDSGPEGIACVDDTARAAILALRVYEMTGNTVARELASGWLRFVIWMQRSPDSRLLNFILDEQGTRNEDGQTSFPGGEPWTVRAIHAFAVAWRVLRDEDCLRRFWHTIFPATGNLQYTGRYALAVMDIYETQPERGLRTWIEDMCEEIIASGPGYFRNQCSQIEVDLYDYHQLQAVARGGHLLARPAYVEACESTVSYLVEPVIRAGFYHRFPTQQDHQSVFDVSSIAEGLEALYTVTGKPRYRDLALECVAWLDGNNPAHAPVYDPHTGRCHDNINQQGEIAPTTGAESAIEAGFLHLVRCRLEGTRIGLLPDDGA